MDPSQALEDLKEISSQIESAALFSADGAVIASTYRDEASTRRFVETARALLAAAEAVPHDASPGQLAQLEVATLEGSVFVVRDSERVVAATTKPDPTVGLVFYDLKSSLRSAAAGPGEDGKPRPQANPSDVPSGSSGLSGGDTAA